MDKQNDIVIENSDHDNYLKNQKEFQSVSNVINFEGDFLKKIQVKIAEISSFIKKFKILEDPQYYLSSNEYKSLLKKTKLRIEKLIFQTLVYTNKQSMNKEDFDIRNFNSITEQVDDLLERVSNCIDILNGKKKDKTKMEIDNELSEIKKNIDDRYSHIGRNYVKNQTDKLINQTDFDEFDIDNSLYPFIPKIKYKPNAVVPLNNDINEAREMRKVNAKKFKQINYSDIKNNKDITEKILFENAYKDEIRQFFEDLTAKFEQINFILNQKKDKLKFTKLKLYDLLKLDSIPELSSSNNSNQQVIVKNYLNKKISLEEKYNYLKDYDNYHEKIFNNSEKIKSLETILENNSNNIKKDEINFYEIEYLNLDITNLIFVDTEEKLEEMLLEIKQYSKEIAVDLEHHCKESYLGITCLIQISTRFNDFIIDALKLRNSLHQLNFIFTDPKIVKVLHGADFDVEWLQKDFGVYIVNMFDTGQAARLLNFSSFSLAFLLSQICGINADKKYQLADWRVRPIPDDMLKYAREDTHYLLYIYDVLKNQLLKKSIMRSEALFYNLMITFKKSCDLTLKNYSKPPVKGLDFFQLRTKNISILNQKQFSLMKLIYKFRDILSRKLDFSTNYILTNKLIYTLAAAFDYNEAPNFKNKILEILYNKENNGKFMHFAKNINELMELINVKLEKLSKKSNDKDSKVLENNYLENMKKNYYNSNKIIYSSKNNYREINVFGIIQNNTNSTENKNLGEKNTINLKEISNGITICDLENKYDIRLPFSENNDSKYSDSYNNDKKNKVPTLTFPSLDYKDEYNLLINKFNNFNLISFLQERKKNLQITVKKIDKKEDEKESNSNNPTINTETPKETILVKNNKLEEKKIQKPIMVNPATNNKAEEKLEKFLQMKRRQEMIDLTDYKKYDKKKEPNTVKIKHKNKDGNLNLNSSDEENSNLNSSDSEIKDFIDKRKGLINNKLNLKKEQIKDKLFESKNTITNSQNIKKGKKK